MKKYILNYLAPEVDIYDVVVERGYGDSTPLPEFDSEKDSLIY